jgi:heme/copper-type cytochrome/quinol oxidase subunit 2
MQSKGARIGVVVVAAAVVVVLFFVLREGDDESTTTSVADETTATQEEPAGDAINPTEEPKPKPPEPEVVKAEIEVEAGQPVGGVEDIEVPSGEDAVITVTTPDTVEHVHLHGYDIFADLAPGQPAKLEFKADIDGVFEMELEDSVVPIAEVTVD